MITLADVPEILAYWRAGEATTEEVCERCLDLFVENRGEEIMSALPPDLAAHFEATLRADFENDTPAEDYIWFNSGSGDHPYKVQIIQGVRAYLRGMIA